MCGDKNDQSQASIRVLTQGNIANAEIPRSLTLIFGRWNYRSHIMNRVKQEIARRVLIREGATAELHSLKSKTLI